MHRSTRAQAPRVCVVCVAGRRACGWQRVDVRVWLCAGLWMLVPLCVYRCYLGCLHARSLMCVCVTSHLRPVQKQEDAFWWHVEAPRADLLSPPPLTFSLALSFFFLSIFKY